MTNGAKSTPVEPLSYREVLEELAASRGFDGAEDLARRAVELDPSYTVEELLERAPGGFGRALDAVMHLDEDEKERLYKAFMHTFLRNPRRTPELGGAGFALGNTRPGLYHGLRPLQ